MLNFFRGKVFSSASASMFRSFTVYWR